MSGDVAPAGEEPAQPVTVLALPVRLQVVAGCSIGHHPLRVNALEQGMSEEQGPGWQRWVSSRHRARRHPETGEWQIETSRLHERSSSGPVTVRAYIDALAEPVSDSLVESFAGSPGSDMAVFELEDAGRVHVLARRCLVLACQPILAAYPLTADVDQDAFRTVFPLLARIASLRWYVWDTPAYRSIAKELGFDPDDHRPVFSPQHQALVNALESWMFKPGNPNKDHSVTVGRVLELIRTDQKPGRGLHEEVRGYLPLYRRINVPRLDEIERLVVG